MFMQAGVADSIDEHLAQLASTEDECKASQKSLQDQILATQQRLQEQQGMLAEATVMSTEASEQLRLKSQQWDQFQAEHAKTTAFCKDSLTQAATELCKIKTIRKEIMNMHQQSTVLVQDCEVSAWTPEPCSVPCGGGVRLL